MRARKTFRLTKKEPSSAGRLATCSAPIRISKDNLSGPSFCIINSLLNTFPEYLSYDSMQEYERSKKGYE